jgi:predicted ATPase
VYQALNERVKARLDWLESLPKKPDLNNRMPSGMGWVSFIGGTRGAGKSTFLPLLNSEWVIYGHIDRPGRANL